MTKVNGDAFMLQDNLDSRPEKTGHPDLDSRTEKTGHPELDSRLEKTGHPEGRHIMETWLPGG